MRVLLTRAADDARRTGARLQAAGHKVIISPVIDIAPTGVTWPEGVVDGVIATSGHAFMVMSGWSQPAPEARRLMPLFLVGERTGELARQNGFAGKTLVVQNSATLALAISELKPVPQRLVYLAARDRKLDIEVALHTIRQDLEIREIYEAREVPELTPEAVDSLLQSNVGAVLHFSRRSAALFIRLAEAADLAIHSLTHLCLSNDVAHPLSEAGCDIIKIAKEPSEAEILALVDES